ncbi:MAG: outer membrane beta-barrel protein [Terriglobia bacterium]
MKKLSTAAWLLMVSLFICAGASGQGIPAGFDVFAEAGPSCLSGPVHSGASGEVKCNGGRFFAGARVRLTRHDAVEASYSYSPDVFNEAYPLTYTNRRIHSHAFNYVRYFSANRYLQPFATVGIGWMTFSDFHGAVEKVADSPFAWNFGGGIDVIPFRYFAVRLEMRDYRTTIPIYHTSGLENWVPSVGIVFRWNRNPKL